MRHKMINFESLAGVEALKLIARFSLLLAITVLIIFGITLWYFGINEIGYNEVLKKLWDSHNNLLKLVWLTGGFFVVIIATTTWALSLYSSFRLAGPLFRLSKQLGLITQDQNSQFTRLRHKDSSVLKLSYRSLREAIRIGKSQEKEVLILIQSTINSIENENLNQTENNLHSLQKQVFKVKCQESDESF